MNEFRVVLQLTGATGQFKIVLTNKAIACRFVLVNARRQPMSYERLIPPAGFPTELVKILAEELAEYNERETRLKGKSDEDNIEERPDDLPDDVPAKATITIKEINDNRYYYWQWRKGDKIKSKYKGPVSSGE